MGTGNILAIGMLSVKANYQDKAAAMQTIATFCRSKGYRWQKISFAVLIVCGLNSCASIPAAEFSDYVHTFGQVRNASELVLLDYASAKKEKLALDQQQKGIPYQRHSSFQTNKLILPKESVNDIAIRFKAWDIIDTYNQALTNILAGKPPETEDKTKGLLRNVFALSGKAIVSTASNISPAFAALSGLGTEIGKIYEKDKTLAILIQVSPVISTKLIADMRKDAALFYQVRYGLNNYYYQQINTKIARKIAEFIKLAQSVPRENRKKNILPLIKTLNKNLAMMAQTSTGKRLKAIQLKSQFGDQDSAQTIEKLKSLQEQILALIEQTQQQDRALDAYRQMLTIYVYMLNELDDRLKLMLQVAQEQQPVEVLENNEFSNTVLKMRQSYLYYQNNKP